MNIYEAAVREVGDSVYGLLVEHAGWCMELQYEDGLWTARVILEIWTGGESREQLIDAAGVSPSEAMTRCAEKCEAAE